MSSAFETRLVAVAAPQLQADVADSRDAIAGLEFKVGDSSGRGSPVVHLVRLWVRLGFARDTQFMTARVKPS